MAGALLAPAKEPDNEDETMVGDNRSIQRHLGRFLRAR